MSIAERYFRFPPHLVLWWTIMMRIVLSVLIFRVLLDWSGNAGWGYPWYAGVLVAAMFLFTHGVRKLARLGLRAIEEGAHSLPR
jgi:hypothetical protein